MRNDGRKRFKIPGRALEVSANVDTAFAFQSPKAVISRLPEVINFVVLVKVYISEMLFTFLAEDMTTPTLKLYPSKPIENNDLEPRIEKYRIMLRVLLLQVVTKRNDYLLQ